MLGLLYDEPQDISLTTENWIALVVAVLLTLALSIWVVNFENSLASFLRENCADVSIINIKIDRGKPTGSLLLKSFSYSLLGRNGPTAGGINTPTAHSYPSQSRI